MSPNDSSGRVVSVELRLKIMGAAATVSESLPADQMRLDQALPLLQKIDNAVVDRAIANSEAAGRPISCCRGCSACCRAQPVPITPPEAYALSLLVDGLPEPRQSEVRARFADRVRRLSEAVLASVYFHRDPELSQEAARAIARDYFRLGLVCPFLEDDACGIYSERPFVCRQYLVTSPASWCANPFDNPVAVLPVPIAAATAFLDVTAEKLGGDRYTIPLVLALEYVARHREELERTFDPAPLMNRCLEKLLS
jgi:Fe-S-cluster containining protein